MKKFFHIFTALIMALTVAGCTKETEQQNKITDYIAAKANTVYVYDEPVTGGWSIHNDYIKDGFIQRKILAGEQSVGEVLLIKDGEMRLVRTQANYYTMEDLTSYDFTGNDLILKEPLVKGNRWTVAQGGSDGDLTAEITDMAAKITVPYGTFDAMEITVSFANSDSYQREYYVKDLGLIKMETILADGSVYSAELSDIKEESSFSANMRFYYPDTENGGIGYQERNAVFTTNMDAHKYIEDNLKQYDDGKTPVFSSDVKINGIRVYYDDDYAVIDLSSHFLTETSRDEETERLTLEALTATLCYFYGINEIELKIDGKNYESENFSMKDGERLTLQVD